MGKKKSIEYKTIRETIFMDDIKNDPVKVIGMVKDAYPNPVYVANESGKRTAVLMSMKDYREYKRLKKQQYEWEMQDTLEAIRDAEEGRKNGTLKELKGSVKDLWLSLQEKDEDL